MVSVPVPSLQISLGRLIFRQERDFQAKLTETYST